MPRQPNQRPHTPTVPLADPHLQPLLDRLHITRWDCLLLGDGSGSGWQLGCGWACGLIPRATHGRKLFCGGLNTGTAFLAETVAYMAPLHWYHYYREKHQLKGLACVHIITDNKALAQQGQQYRTGTLPPKSNPGFWGMLRGFEQAYGLVIYTHWQARNTTAINGLMDVIAGNSRTTLRDMQIPGADRELSDYLYQTHLDNHDIYQGLRRP